jgi:hypothetical protein
MGKKKIRDPYERRNQIITIRLKYWEAQDLKALSSKLGWSVSDICRMLITLGLEKFQDGENPMKKGNLEITRHGEAPIEETSSFHKPTTLHSPPFP